MFNTKKRISISLCNRSSFDSHRSLTKKKPVYDRMVPKLQDRTLSELKSKTRTIEYKKKRKSTLSQRLSECLSDSNQSAKNFLIRSSQKNTDDKPIRELSETPIKKFQVEDWKDNFYTNLLDWNFSNLICAASDSNLNFYHMSMDEDFQPGAFRKHKVGNPRAKVNSIKFSPLSANIAIGYQNGIFRIYNYFKSEFTYSAPVHTERITALDWNDGMIITGSRDRSFHVLDPRTKGTAVEFRPYHIQQILGAKISGNLIATGGNDNHVYIYDIRNPSDFLTGYTHGAAVKSMTWIHDKKLLITGGGTADKKIKFWSNSKSKIVKQIDTGSQICSITASKNTNQIVSCQGFSLNQIILWGLNGQRRKILHGQHSNRVLYSALSPSGQYMASGAGDKKLLIWKLFPQIEKERGMLQTLQLR